MLTRSASACALLPIAARADLPIATYCIPGVTAERCRGVFWETGKLYRKQGAESVVVSEGEYRAAVASLSGLQNTLAGLRTQRGAKDLSAAAAEARATLRRTGGWLCTALDEERRYDSEFQLNEALAALDEVDRAGLAGDEAGLAPGFGQTSLLYERALKSLDAFLAGLPELRGELRQGPGCRSKAARQHLPGGASSP